jgi:hypothetical protein
MREENCELEPVVLAAARTENWDNELRRHLDHCPGCTDALMVERFLSSDSREVHTETRLPTADQVWWRADLRHRREMARRAQLPIRVLEKVAQASGVAAAGVGLAWSAPTLMEWLGRLAPTAASASGTSLSWTSAVWLALGTGVVLSLILVGLETLWVEE